MCMFDTRAIELTPHLPSATDTETPVEAPTEGEHVVPQQEEEGRDAVELDTVAEFATLSQGRKHITFQVYIAGRLFCIAVLRT